MKSPKGGAAKLAASLNTSPDGQIIKVLDADSRTDLVFATVRVPLLPEQSSYFRKQLELGHVITCINSVKARIGLEQRLVTAGAEPFTFVEDGHGAYVLYNARFYSFRNEFLEMGMPVTSLFVEGVPVGKLYARNSDLQLDAAMAEQVLGKGSFFYRNGASFPSPEPYIYPDGTLLLPLHHAVVKRPDTQQLTPEFLRRLMRKEVTRAQLEGIMVTETLPQEQLAANAFSQGSSPILAIPLGTAGLELVVTDPRHGDSRVAEADTHGQFYVELLTGSYGVPEGISSFAPSDLFLRVKLYKPLTP